MDLLDALCANEGVNSVVELSLNGLFRRKYSALYAALNALKDIPEPALLPEATKSNGPEKKEFPRAWIEAIAKVIPAPKQKNYWLFGVDVTSMLRSEAATLKDRESVYHPTRIGGNKPIGIGHNYSLMAAIPEAEVAGGKSWIVPASVERVTSFESQGSVGQTKVKRLLADESLPWHQELCVLVADSAYSHRGFLYPLGEMSNRVIVTRCRSNRVFYRLPKTPEPKRRGHPRWYGERFELQDETPWDDPDERESFSITTAQSRTRTVILRRWHNLLMKGSKAQPMHHYPFDLLPVQLADSTGQRIFKPQWLIVLGLSRRQLSSVDVYESYRQRFHLEQGIRFGKQHLLLNRLQTPQVNTSERWVQFSFLAYAQLWAARSLAQLLPLPWQRYLPIYQLRLNSPSIVHRDFSRIIRTLGTPAASVQPRGYSPGRQAGTKLKGRPKRPIVKQGRARRKKNQKRA